MDVVTLALAKKAISEGYVDPEMIKGTVESYLEQNPITPGATDEEKGQIYLNTQAIEEIKSRLDETAATEAEILDYLGIAE